MSAGVASINVLLRCVRHRQGTRRNVLSPHVHDDNFADIRCDCWRCHDCWGANLHGPATAASTHEGRRVQGLLLNPAVQRPRRLHLHRAAELGFGANLWAVVAGGGASHRHPHVRQGASPSRRPLGVPATLIEPLNGVTTH